MKSAAARQSGEYYNIVWYMYLKRQFTYSNMNNLVVLVKHNLILAMSHEAIPPSFNVLHVLAGFFPHWSGVVGSNHHSGLFNHHSQRVKSAKSTFNAI